MSVSCKSNSNKDGNWVPFWPFPDSKKDADRTCQTQLMRTRTLLIAGMAIIAAGLLLPLSGRILDVLLIFSLSLTIAVLIITFSARRAVEVLGFPLLIVLAAMLRMALSVAGSKLILSQGSAGTIIGFLGSIFVRDNFVFTILALGVLTVVIFGTISKAAKSISHTTEEFVADIVPARQISIDNDLATGLIDHSQAIQLRDGIARETGFFVAMTGAAKFILCAAVIELMIVVVDIVASIATAQGPPAAAQMSAGYSIYEGLQNGHLKIHATLGAGMITQISALLAAMACRYLVRKTYVPCVADGQYGRGKAAERVKVISSEVPSAPAAESQYGNAVVAIQAQATAEELEWLDGSQCIENGKDDFSQTVPSSTKALGHDLLTSEIECVFEPSPYIWKATDDSDYYGAITELIESKSGDDAKTILMAAESAKELPVTVPVNIAIRMARKGQRCLLIDFDLQRDAISSVFDINPKGADYTVYQGAVTAGSPTGINNLWVWSASRLTNTDKDSEHHEPVDIKKALASFENRYDRVVVYAPDMGRLADLDGITACVQAAMLFGGEAKLPDALGDSAIRDFYKLLISCGCNILQPRDVFAELS
jgi:Mrp family chromosome partitioning ATPase